jgi:hypothetical protein
VQFVIDDPACSTRPHVELAPHTVAIDLGWRKMESGVRVAVWRDTAGSTGELRVPQRLVDRWTKVSDLASIQAKNFTGALEFLRAHRAAGGWPEWLMHATETAHAWRSAQRLASLVWRWREVRFDGDGDVYAHLEAWRKQDKHLYQWETHQRANVLRARRELYRLCAQSLARYRTVVIEGDGAAMDLRPMIEHETRGDDPALEASQGRRFVVAPGEFRIELRHACAKTGAELLVAKAANTTRRCAACGAVRERGAKLVQVCQCGVTWDQDENASDNLLRAATCGEAKPIRSRTKHEEKTGETAVVARRRKGLVTRRASRSRRVAQEADLTIE